MFGNLKYKIPVKKYQIVANQNKVFELSDRKRFCSSDCFAASKYLQEQISLTPVWLRDTPKYLAEEANKQITLIDMKEKKKKTNKKSDSSHLDEFKEIENELREIEMKWKEKYEEKKKEEEKVERIVENNIYKKITVEERPPVRVGTSIDRAQLMADIEKKRKEFLTTKLFQKPTELKLLSKIMDTSALESKQMSSYLFVEYLLERLNGLLTEKTRDYLRNHVYSSDAKCELQEEREREQSTRVTNVNANSAISNASSESTTNSRKQKEEISIDDDLTEEEREMKSKIEYLETVLYINSNVNDASETAVQLTENETTESMSRRPLPDYEKLKEEALSQQLRVKEFFKGYSASTKSRAKDDDDDAATVIDLNGTNSDLYNATSSSDDYNLKMVIKIKETNEEIVRQLPTVDSKSQIVIRRKIFYEKLLK